MCISSKASTTYCLINKMVLQTQDPQEMHQRAHVFRKGIDWCRFIDILSPSSLRLSIFITALWGQETI